MQQDEYLGGNQQYRINRRPHPRRRQKEPFTTTNSKCPSRNGQISCACARSNKHFFVRALYNVAGSEYCRLFGSSLSGYATRSFSHDPYHLSCNVPSDMCPERRFKSVCAFSQSDQSHPCRVEETLHSWLSKI